MKDKKKELKEKNAKEVEKAKPLRDQEQPEDDEPEEDPAQAEGDKQLMKRLGIDPKKAAEEPIEDEEEEPDYIEQEPEPTSLDAKEEPEADYGAFNEDEGKEWDPNYGRKGIIDEEVIGEAKNTYEKYKQNLEKFKKRIVENEKWWQFKQWEVIGDTQGKENDPKPESAWMFNSLANKHADAMDNYPMPNLLPREESDKGSALSLSKIVPCILDNCDFQQIYSDAWWYKLKQGFCVYATYWDNTRDNGAGDIAVKQIDVLNLLWEPGIKYIQDSPNIFLIDAVDNDILVGMYPDLEGVLSNSAGAEIVKYDTERDDSASNRTVVYDWYYKQTVNGRTIVHYCKFIDGHVLFASENCEEYLESGYYISGEYPFVVDNLFPVESEMLGFGYIDVMKSPQMVINKMDQIVAKNAALVGKPRWAINKNSGVNPEQVADYSQDFFEVNGRIEEGNIKQFQTTPLPSLVMNYLEMKKEELKETSGNRDFSQGSTAAGVTAASAIAALQEAGSKLSRDMIGGSYRAYVRLVKQIIELIRQFYDEPRCFRIDGEGGSYEFISFENSLLKETTIDDVTGQPEIVKKPIFDVKISAAKKNAFNRASQNETVKELYGMGVFNPNNYVQAGMLLDAMDFEGVEELRRKVGENGNLNEKLNQLAGIAMQMAGMLDQTVGAGEFTSQVQQALGMEVAPQLNAAAYEARRGIDRPVNTRAANIRDRASNQASVGEGHDISKTDE